MDGAAIDSPVASINPRLAVQKSGFSSVVAILARRLFSQNEMQNLRLGFSQSQSQLNLVKARNLLIIISFLKTPSFLKISVQTDTIIKSKST